MIFSKTRKWNRWSGSIKDLAAVADTASEAIQKWCPDQKIASSVEIETGDLTTDADTTDAVRSIDERDLALVNWLSMRIYVSERGLFSTPRVSIRVNKNAPALAIEIHGEDRVGVEGLHAQLIGILDRGHRKPRWLQHHMLYIIFALLPSPGILLGVSTSRWLGLSQLNGKWDTAEILGVVVGIVISLGTGVGLLWLTPDLELVPHGRGTRLRRYRTWLWGTTFTIIVGLAVSWLYGLLTHVAAR